MQTNDSTILVGAGVLNLVSAYFLIKEGYSIKIFDKAPAPVSPKANWKNQGCTFGGENVRMYTYTEADNYNPKVGGVYTNMNTIFKNTMKDGGWLIKGQETLNEREKQWISDFKEVNTAAAAQYSEDIYFVNKESRRGWETMMNEDSFLFDNTNIVNGILRIYSAQASFERAKGLHTTLGSFIDDFDPKRIVEKYPLFENAVKENHLGGAMITEGFTLQVKDFCNNLIQLLENEGAEFYWNAELTKIEYDNNNKVSGLWIDNELHTAKNYVLSLGAYAGNLLQKTATNNAIHGVLGAWLVIPNIYDALDFSMKIHKAGTNVGEDSNVTLAYENGSKVLVIGSGYGYTGNATTNRVNAEDLAVLYKSIEHTATTYFPEAFETIKSSVDYDKKYCIRSFTPNGLGIFESIESSTNGHLIITGGNNTGGFTQAPYIAEAISKVFSNEKHPMHQLFHPQRGGEINLAEA